jgi:hypothetical protein
MMNKSSNGLKVIPDGLGAVSAEELNGVEGGLLGLPDLYESVLDTSSWKAFYESIASWNKVLGAISRGERP